MKTNNKFSDENMRNFIRISPEEKERCISSIEITFLTATCCDNLTKEDREWLAKEIWIGAVSKIAVDDQPNKSEDGK